MIEHILATQRIYNSTEIKLECLKDLQANIQNLIDERNEAERAAVDEYSTGYVDGLTMALSILDGLQEE